MYSINDNEICMVKNFVAFYEQYSYLVEHINKYIRKSQAGSLSQEKAHEAKTQIINNLLNMIHHCDESLSVMDGVRTDTLMSEKAAEIFNRYVDPYIKNTAAKPIEGASKPYFLMKKPIAEAAQRLQEEHAGLFGQKQYSPEEKKLKSAVDFKLGIINIVANICHDLAKFLRKVRGRESLADLLETYTEKAAKEISREAKSMKKQKTQRGAHTTAAAHSKAQVQI
jgi:hypothetical protein